MKISQYLLPISATIIDRKGPDELLYLVGGDMISFMSKGDIYIAYDMIFLCAQSNSQCSMRSMSGQG